MTAVDPKELAASSKPSLSLVPPIAMLAASEAAIRQGAQFPGDAWFSAQRVHRSAHQNMVPGTGATYRSKRRHISARRIGTSPR